jgi:hypothetical protein
LSSAPLERAAGGTSGRARIFAPLPLVIAVVVALISSGCGGAEKTRAERERVAKKIDALRNADDTSLETRRKLLRDLEDDATKDALGVAARDACVSAYKALLESLTQSEEVEATMKLGERLDPIDMKRKLDAASKLIERSEQDMPKCDKAATDLKTAKP